jgi:photosynthetic reaction center cytochrome c subunit
MNPLKTFLTRGFALLAASLALAGCERPPMETTQIGYRGTGMEQVTNPRLLAAEADKHVAPPAQPPVPSDGPKASQVYQNVKVLGDLSVGEFTRLMVAMTAWVSPEQGCNYCHNPQNLADDSIYTKVVARRMIEMTQHINGNWKTHVANTGVTCFTCHRGKPVPEEVWFVPPLDRQAPRMAGSRAGQNAPAPAAGLASLPYDPFTPYLLREDNIRVAGPAALPDGHVASIQSTEATYALMMHMSEGLGVNCTFCHNSRAFSSWQESTPQRVTAWHGIRMARDLNTEYLEPLTSTFPANRLGPTGDVAKINCATCHQGANKPLKGAAMLQAHPELAGLVQATAMPAAPAAAETPADAASR